MRPVLLETRNGYVEYSYEGQGPPLLVLKGGHCSRYTDLSHGSLIHEGYSLLTVSRPGYDKTEVKTGKTPEAFADTLIEVLDHLHIKKLPVIAISAAGPTGIALASKYPERVDKLVMEAALVTPWDKNYKRKGRLLFGRGEAVTWKLLKLLLRIHPDYVMRMILTELTTEDPNALLQKLSRRDRRFLYEMLDTSRSGRGFSADMNHQVSDLSKITVPVLGLYAKKDRSVSYTNAVLLKSSVPQSDIYDVNADSHLIWIGDAAQEVWQKRLEFLKMTS
ncbi:alpha/beta fold hydrolase [Thalassobacillus pellis]|uniref:alpha/beta fold hydrolase n=1 Tax=Thalassobacillus pellis TaxID=748008 RepID=UPI001960BE07|nr:alpha/beta hydrolase [Thalassobacillus pellis]MBM7551139.1 pimeloyl-ACP methyl ester carboxylesterase [Thalassobacillus pellis]